MINILRGSEMKDSQRKTYRDETPERGSVRPFLPEGESHLHESGLENIDISIMRDSHSKMSPEKTSRTKLVFDQEPTEIDYLKLREELREIREENHRLKNYVSMLKSELISVAHNKVPPELQSPMSRLFLLSGNKDGHEHQPKSGCNRLSQEREERSRCNRRAELDTAKSEHELQQESPSRQLIS
jgi:hypothetical protein